MPTSSLRPIFAEYTEAWFPTVLNPALQSIAARYEAVQAVRRLGVPQWLPNALLSADLADLWRDHYDFVLREHGPGLCRGSRLLQQLEEGRTYNYLTAPGGVPWRSAAARQLYLALLHMLGHMLTLAMGVYRGREEAAGAWWWYNAEGQRRPVRRDLFEGERYIYPGAHWFRLAWHLHVYWPEQLDPWWDDEDVETRWDSQVGMERLRRMLAEPDRAEADLAALGNKLADWEALWTLGVCQARRA